MEVKKSWSPIKEMLFTYLAITKVMYWMNTIMVLEQRGLSSVSQAVMNRLLNQDAILIVSVIAFYYLDKKIQLKQSKYSKVLEHIIFYTIGFAALMGMFLFTAG